MNKNFLKNEAGDTNIISILIILAVIVALTLLFKNYIADLVSMIIK